MKSIAYSKGFKYQSREPFKIQLEGLFVGPSINTEWISLSTSGLLHIKAGYAWDGCSGPTYDTRNTMRGSKVHDALYELIRKGHLDRDNKPRVDEIFREILLEDKVCKLRANCFHWAVVKFGRGATLPSHKKEILYAP